MRRTRAIFLAVAAAAPIALLPAAPALAHDPVFTPNEARPGVRGTWSMLADSDVQGDPIAAVELVPPATFTLEDVTTGAPGWTREDRPGAVRFAGPPTAVGNVVLRVTGVPRAKGVVAFDVVTRSAGGVEKRRRGSCLDPTEPLKGAVLFVGIDPVTACDPPASGGPPWRAIGIGLVAAGVVLGAGYPVVRRARARSAPG